MPRHAHFGFGLQPPIMQMVATTFLLLVLFGISTTTALKLSGVNYNPRKGQDWEPTEKKCESAAEIAADFKALSTITSNIRLYSMSAGLKVWLGIWIGPNGTGFEAEKVALAGHIEKGLIDSNVIGLHVGSEAIYRKDITADQAIKYFQDIKAMVTTAGLKFPVTIADIGDSYIQNPRLYQAVDSCVDVISINQFPFWQKRPIEGCIQFFCTRVTPIIQAAAAANKSLMIGKTGWPTAGVHENASVAFPENAALWLNDFASLANQLNWTTSTPSHRSTRHGAPTQTRPPPTSKPTLASPEPHVETLPTVVKSVVASHSGHGTDTTADVALSLVAAEAWESYAQVMTLDGGVHGPYRAGDRIDTLDRVLSSVMGDLALVIFQGPHFRGNQTYVLPRQTDVPRRTSSRPASRVVTQSDPMGVAQGPTGGPDNDVGDGDDGSKQPSSSQRPANPTPSRVNNETTWRPTTTSPAHDTQRTKHQQAAQTCPSTIPPPEARNRSDPPDVDDNPQPHLADTRHTTSHGGGWGILALVVFGLGCLVLAIVAIRQRRDARAFGSTTTATAPLVDYSSLQWGDLDLLRFDQPNFPLVHPLASGATGAIFLGTFLDQPVAIKDNMAPFDM
ncbi:Aste57867_21208 [Aphanomyces stellatus]|uniref:glucan endo-1,3-beta-D-glucosidase n=1 Tax=Aphanomyces stellatus TaxID=120398 RepID=A0A485LGX1_9STRA|nr:hypothetical protein As57867_021140 [Aphanomyces stellatus]VFT97881.1 Aste57867_21208 [Aphanomyces stellatus]